MWVLGRSVLCGGIAVTDAEVLSRLSVGGGAVRVERNDQFQLVAENDGEVWFCIQFVVLRIKDVWECGDVERWVKFWSEDGGDHELLGGGTGPVFPHTAGTC